MLSDNGSRMAVCSWGDQAVTHPQFMVFDRTVHIIGSITTSGSPFSLDMSGDGQYILGGNKSVHANTFGNGGLTTLLQLPVANTCYANCDGSTTPPILNVLDFTCFLNKFAAGATYANCDASTTPPVLNVLDFACFLNRFAAGCSYEPSPSRLRWPGQVVATGPGGRRDGQPPSGRSSTCTRRGDGLGRLGARVRSFRGLVLIEALRGPAIGE